MLAKNTMESAPVLGVFDSHRTRKLARIGRAVLRYGLVGLLVLWGGFKFTAFEAEGIRPLIEHSPLLHWLYPVLGVRGASDLIGVVEITAGLLMCARHWRPGWSALGSLIAAGGLGALEQSGQPVLEHLHLGQPVAVGLLVGQQGLVAGYVE